MSQDRLIQQFTNIIRERSLFCSRRWVIVKCQLRLLAQLSRHHHAVGKRGSFAAFSCYGGSKSHSYMTLGNCLTSLENGMGTVFYVKNLISRGLKELGFLLFGFEALDQRLALTHSCLLHWLPSLFCLISPLLFGCFLEPSPR